MIQIRFQEYSKDYNSSNFDEQNNNSFDDELQENFQTLAERTNPRFSNPSTKCDTRKFRSDSELQRAEFYGKPFFFCPSKNL